MKKASNTPPIILQLKYTPLKIHVAIVSTGKLVSGNVVKIKE